jgi:hypothetical protein
LDRESGDAGNQMQKAMRRIERRVQREHMVAVTGNADADSDEDLEEDIEAADGDVAQLDEDGKDDNDKEDGEEEQEYQQSKGPKNQYDLNDDFIDDSEARSLHQNASIRVLNLIQMCQSYQCGDTLAGHHLSVDAVHRSYSDAR